MTQETPVCFGVDSTAAEGFGNPPSSSSLSLVDSRDESSRPRKRREKGHGQCDKLFSGEGSTQPGGSRALRQFTRRTPWSTNRLGEGIARPNEAPRGCEPRGRLERASSLVGRFYFSREGPTR